LVEGSSSCGVENRHLPLTRPMAYTTACTTVQAVIAEIKTNTSATSWLCIWKCSVNCIELFQ